MDNSWTFMKEDDRKNLPLSSKDSKINWSRRPVTVLIDVHYKECDKNWTSQLMILSQE